MRTQKLSWVFERSALNWVSEKGSVLFGLNLMEKVRYEFYFGGQIVIGLANEQGEENSGTKTCEESSLT